MGNENCLHFCVTDWYNIYSIKYNRHAIRLNILPQDQKQYQCRRLAGWLVVLCGIREMCSNIGRETGYPDCGILMFLFTVRSRYCCGCRARLKRDGTRAETRFGLSAKRTSQFKMPGSAVQSTTGSRSVRISTSNGSNAGYTMF